MDSLKLDRILVGGRRAVSAIGIWSLLTTRPDFARLRRAASSADRSVLPDIIGHQNVYTDAEVKSIAAGGVVVNGSSNPRSLMRKAGEIAVIGSGPIMQPGLIGGGGC